MPSPGLSTLPRGKPGVMASLIEDHVKLRGVIPALVTPFNADGTVNTLMTKKLVAYHLAEGANGFYVCGNTGEGAEMTVAERMQQTQAVVEAANGRPVLVHVGGCSAADACVLAKHAKQVGAMGTSAMPPSGASVSVTDIVTYFETIGAATDLPFYVYWVPSGISDLNADEFLTAMKTVPCLAGIKYTDKNFFKFQQLMALAPKILGFPLNALTGPDEMMVAGLAMGSHGAIGSTYNVNIKLAVKTYNEFVIGNVTEAARFQARCNDIIEVLIKKSKIYEGGPGTNIIAAIKCLYAARGFDCGEARAFQLTEVEKADLVETVESLRFEYA